MRVLWPGHQLSGATYLLMPDTVHGGLGAAEGTSRLGEETSTNHHF